MYIPPLKFLPSFRRLRQDKPYCRGMKDILFMLNIIRLEGIFCISQEQVELSRLFAIDTQVAYNWYSRKLNVNSKCLLVLSGSLLDCVWTKRHNLARDVGDSCVISVIIQEKNACIFYAYSHIQLQSYILSYELLCSNAESFNAAVSISIYLYVSKTSEHFGQMLVSVRDVCSMYVCMFGYNFLSTISRSRINGFELSEKKNRFVLMERLASLNSFQQKQVQAV